MPKNFNDLLSQNLAREHNAQKPPAARLPATTEQLTALQWIDEELIDDNPFQPRARMNEVALRQLVQSLNEQGQLQPARVRAHPEKKGRFQLVFGHRRRQAVRLGANAGSQETTPNKFIGQLRCEIAPATDEQMLEAAYAENEDREEFSVFDRAGYFQTLRAFHSPQNPKLSPGTISLNANQIETPNARLVSWEELAKTKTLPLSPRAIRRLVQVLELPQEMRETLSSANLGSEEQLQFANEKHCRALLLLQNQTAQNQLLQEIIESGLSGNQALRRAEQLLKSADKTDTKRAQKPSSTPNSWQMWTQETLRPTLKQLEKSLSKAAQNPHQQAEIANQLEALAAQIRAQIQVK